MDCSEQFVNRPRREADSAKKDSHSCKPRRLEFEVELIATVPVTRGPLETHRQGFPSLINVGFEE